MPPGPILLAIESATEVLSTALMDGESVLVEVVGEPGQHHAETVLRQVDEVLTGAAIPLHGVEGFAVSIGPGSFTSLRIGLSTVKGLAFGGASPVAPVSTLRALAFAGTPSPSSGGAPTFVAPLLDARRGEAYAAVFEWRGEALAEVVPEGVYFPDALAALLPGACRVLGPGTELFGAAVRDAASHEVEIGSPAPPRAATVGVLGARSLAAGEGVAAGALAPRYLRRTQAEEVRAAEGR